MDGGAFDALTRQAPFVTRGLEGMAAFGNSTAAAAKAKKKNVDKKAKQRCRTQIPQCTALITIACTSNPTPLCLDGLDCCDFAGRCDFAGFVNCLTEVG